jgi:hypothetical protein
MLSDIDLDSWVKHTIVVRVQQSAGLGQSMRADRARQVWPVGGAIGQYLV